MKTTICCCLILLVAFSTLAQEQPITLTTATGNIEGTFTMPATEKRVPIVLLISGSGPTDRNGNQQGLTNNSLKMLAEALQRNGIASVRFDKRGIGASADKMMKERDLRFDQYITDVKDWITLLSTDKRFSKIIVAGHSEGALLGMIASEHNKAVKGYISIAGAGRAADVILKEQLASQPQEVRDLVFPKLDSLKKGDTLHNVSPMLYTLFRPSVQPYMISWMRYDPQAEIKNLTIPILILQGTTDIQVSVADAELLAKANPKALKKLIPGMNHVLKQCTSTEHKAQMEVYKDPSLPLDAVFVQEVLNFIRGL